MEAIVACVLENRSSGQVDVFFVTEERICTLHEEHFNDPSPTDCMTFPMDPPGPDCEMLGTVFVCPKTAICYCEDQGTDAYEECTLYIVHGLLHLLGLRDKTESEQKEMRQAETKCMDLLRSRHLILTPPTC